MAFTFKDSIYMNVNIKYKNFFDEEITPQQIAHLDQYTEQTFIDGILKKEIQYYENEIDYFCVYIYPNENVDAILSTLNVQDFTYTIGKDYEIINGYTVWKFYDFKNGVFNSDYTVMVYDLQGRNIAYAGYFGDGSLRQGGVKTYYLEGKILYDEDGDIDIAYKDTSDILFDFTSGSLHIDVTFDVGLPYTSIGNFVQDWQELLPFMTPDILAYFTNIEPLVPNVEFYT